jgi:hypothetical protein
VELGDKTDSGTAGIGLGRIDVEELLVIIPGLDLNLDVNVGW